MSPDAHNSERHSVRAVFLVVLLALGLPAFAQDPQCDVGREVPGGALDETTYRLLNGVYEAVGAEKYDEAYEDLQRMLKRAGNDAYLRAILNQALAQVEWSRENYDAALTHFETAVELDVLPNQAHFALMYQIAQVYYSQERYAEALDRLELWFCTAPEERITSAAYVLEASIHTSMENYTEALVAIDTAIAMVDEPKEQWYQLKLGVHYELEQFPQVVQTLEIMVANWPEKKSYWVQLAQSYSRLKQEDEALGVMALAYRKGLLDTETDLVFLSKLYSDRGVPYKSAEVLQKGIEDGIVESNRRHWARVAQAWYGAAELDRSLAAYERAGQASAEGETDLRRGFILVELERWAEAKEALDAALGKGGLEDRDTGQAYLLRGMTHFNLEEYDAARADWERAGRYERTRTAAEQWIAHLREERRRQQAL